MDEKFDDMLIMLAELFHDILDEIVDLLDDI